MVSKAFAAAWPVSGIPKVHDGRCRIFGADPAPAGITRLLHSAGIGRPVRPVSAETLQAGCAKTLTSEGRGPSHLGKDEAASHQLCGETGEARTGLKQLLAAGGRTWPPYLFGDLAAEIVHDMGLPPLDAAAFRKPRQEQWANLASLFSTRAGRIIAMQRVTRAELRGYSARSPFIADSFCQSGAQAPRPAGERLKAPLPRCRGRGLPPRNLVRQGSRKIPAPSLPGRKNAGTGGSDDLYLVLAILMRSTAMSGEGLRKVSYLLLIALIVYVAGPGGA